MSTDTIHSALAAMQRNITSAAKDAKNPHFKSTYASLASVVDAVRTAINGTGLYFLQTCDLADGGVVVKTIIGHASGETMEVAPVLVPVGDHKPQTVGSALTYAKRYSLQMAFGVASDDDDGNGAQAASNGSRPAFKPQDNGTPPPAVLGAASADKMLAAVDAAGMSDDDLLAALEDAGFAGLDVAAAAQWPRAVGHAVRAILDNYAGNRA